MISITLKVEPLTTTESPFLAPDGTDAGITNKRAKGEPCSPSISPSEKAAENSEVTGTTPVTVYDTGESVEKWSTWSCIACAAIWDQVDMLVEVGSRSYVFASLFFGDDRGGGLAGFRGGSGGVSGRLQFIQQCRIGAGQPKLVEYSLDVGGEVRV